MNKLDMGEGRTTNFEGFSGIKVTAPANRKRDALDEVIELIEKNNG